MVLNGTDLAPFLTRQARCAPRAENRIHRSMEKNPRSAVLRSPAGERLLQLIGQSVLPVQVAADRGGDPAAGARCARAPRCAASAWSRPWAPRTRSASSSLLNSSMVVPSIAVTSIWCQAEPVPRSASARAASISKITAHRLLVQQDPGLGQRRAGRGDGCPVSPAGRASRTSGPGPGHNPDPGTAPRRGRHIAVTSAVSARSSLCPCSACATAVAITPSASSSAIRPARRSSPSRSSQNPGPAAACASRPAASAGPASHLRLASGNSGRRRNDHGKLGGQQSSSARR